MADSYDFESPDFFTTGTVGTPGRRVFYLQARQNGRVVSLKLEKEQVGALAEYLAKLLADLPAPGQLPQDMALLEPGDKRAALRQERQERQERQGRDPDEAR